MMIIVHHNVVEVVADQKKFRVEIKIEEDQDQDQGKINLEKQSIKFFLVYIRSGHRSSKHSRSYRSSRSRSRSRDRRRHKRSRSR
jgi:hypothetical protein